MLSEYAGPEMPLLPLAQFVYDALNVMHMCAKCAGFQGFALIL